MAEETDSGEKTEEATPHRLEEMRKKGEVSSSKELNSVFILAASLSATIFSLIFIYECFVDLIHYILKLELQKAFQQEVLSQIIKETVITMIKCTAPTLVTSFCISMLSQIGQIGFIFAPEVLELKLERLDPIKGFGRLFSKKAVFEVLKGLLKFSLIIGISYIFLSEQFTQFSGYFHSDIRQSMEFSKAITMQLIINVLIGLVIMAIIDFAWEKYTYKQKAMMTKQQVKQEHKEREGSPEIKQKIKTLQRQMSQKRMMADVPDADVIVTNPTHLSIALKYDPTKMIAPLVLAKGGDQVAFKIREIAKENNIPMVENVPLARALYKSVEVGEGVPRSLYKAVAEILAFVYKKKNQIKNYYSSSEMR